MPRPLLAAARAHAARALLLALLAAACAGGREPRARPNVVLVVLDTVRADRLGSYGYPRATSPFLDELAARGALFEDATAQAAWTLPSMVSLHHGAYVTVYRDALVADRPVLAEMLRDAGYATIGVVANRGMSPATGFHRGFKIFDQRAARDAHGAPRARDVGEVLEHLRGHLDHADALESERGKPRFLYLHLMDAHAPYDAYAELADVLPEAEGAAGEPMPWDWQREALARRGPAPPDDDPGWAARWEQIRRARARYDQGLRRLDSGLRAIFDELERRGLLDHAVVAVASDHGETLWERTALFADDARYAAAPPEEFFYDEHGQHVNAELVRTPLVLGGAGVPAGLRVAAPVENVDLVPTLLELCDVPPPPGLAGRSLVPLLRGGTLERELAFSFCHNATAVRELATGLKLIQPNPWPTRGRTEVQLYDVARDPTERANLAAERPDDVARLARAIDAWRARHPMPSTMEETLDPEQEARLRALGYTAEDIGR